MDLKARLKNKTFVVTMLVTIVAFIYQVLGICGVTAPITQDDVTQVILIVVNLLAALGILVDPSTPGITDGNGEAAEPENKTEGKQA